VNFPLALVEALADSFPAHALALVVPAPPYKQGLSNKLALIHKTPVATVGRVIAVIAGHLIAIERNLLLG
jgi:hypothetical protein